MPLAFSRYEPAYKPHITDFDVSYTDSFGATIGSQRKKIGTSAIGRYTERFKAETGIDLSLETAFEFAVSPTIAYRGAMQDIEESASRAEYINRGEIEDMYARAASMTPLEFEESGLKTRDYKDQRTRRSVVELDVKNWNYERRAAGIISRRPKGFAGNATVFAGAVLAELTDPISLGVNFIPVIGQAKMLEMTRKYGSFAARSLTATAEGLVGSVLTEGIQAKSEADIGFNEYTVSDAFFNIAVGVGLSFGVHHIGGKISDVAAGRPGARHHTLADKADIDKIQRDNLRSRSLRNQVDPNALDVPEVVREGSRRHIQRALDDDPYLLTGYEPVGSAVADIDGWPSYIKMERVDSLSHGLNELRRHAGDWFERGHTPDASYQFDLLALDELKARGLITPEEYRVKFQEIISKRAGKSVDLSESWLEKDFESKVELDSDATAKKTSAASVDEVLPIGARAVDQIDEANADLYDQIDSATGNTHRQVAEDADAQADGVGGEEFDNAVRDGVDCVTGVEAEATLPARPKTKVVKGKKPVEQKPRSAGPVPTDPIEAPRGMARRTREEEFDAAELFESQQGDRDIPEASDSPFDPPVRRDPSPVPTSQEDIRAELFESQQGDRDIPEASDSPFDPPVRVETSDQSIPIERITELPQEGRDYILARAVEGQEHIETETASLLNNHRAEMLRQRFGEDLPEFSEQGSKNFGGELSEIEHQALLDTTDFSRAPTDREGDLLARENLDDSEGKSQLGKQSLGSGFTGDISQREYTKHINPIYMKFLKKTDLKPLYDADQATLVQYRLDVQEAFTTMKKDINALRDKNVSFSYSLDNTPSHIAEDISFRLNVSDDLRTLHTKVRNSLRSDIDSVNEAFDSQEGLDR